MRSWRGMPASMSSPDKDPGTRAWGEGDNLGAATKNPYSSALGDW